jgi:ADP-heptose:LPS heptosyltransferase
MEPTTNSRQPVLNPKFENWEETAALLANMDGIVSTDNGAGWLAQALGLPTSLLLSGNSDWKYLRGTDKSYGTQKPDSFAMSAKDSRTPSTNSFWQSATAKVSGACRPNQKQEPKHHVESLELVPS